MIKHSSLPDFILFLYVHIADSDDDYSPQELSLIKQKMQTLFPDGTDLERKLYSTIRQYNLFDKTKLHEQFEGGFNHFQKDLSGIKQRVFIDIKDIILADGVIKVAEAKALEMLKKFLDLNE